MVYPLSFFIIYTGTNHMIMNSIYNNNNIITIVHLARMMECE